MVNNRMIKTEVVIEDRLSKTILSRSNETDDNCHRRGLSGARLLSRIIYTTSTKQSPSFFFQTTQPKNSAGKPITLSDYPREQYYLQFVSIPE